LGLKGKKKLTGERRKLITKLSPKSPIAEQYRTIRTNIQFSTIDEEVQTLMITSPGPGEGKSTTIANLAVVFAQQGKKTLLVDTDLRKPTVHYTFNMTNTFGLTNVITKQMGLMEAAVSAEDNLYILPSGPIPPNPAELLGSKAMNEFLSAAKEQFDIILFDTPPVVAVTDAQILANKCDGTILVVSSGKTGIEEGNKAKELLVAAKAKLMGVVLNNRKMKESQYYYYYGAK